MSKWDYMDNKVWESSEVMMELEKTYKKSMEINKKAQSKDLSAMIPTIQKATQAMKDFGKAAKESGFAAKDKLSPVGKGSGGGGKKKIKITKKQYDEAKDKLLNELKSLADDCISKGDTISAYHTERAIDSLSYDDDQLIFDED